MNYCLSNNVAPRYLEQAYEIKIHYKDRDQIKKLSEKYPKASYLLTVPDTLSPFQWEELQTLNLLTQNRLTIIIPNKEFIDDCKKCNIKFIFGYAISNWFELNSVVEAGVSQVRLAPPLTHDLEKVRARLPDDIAIRAVPNVAYDKFFPRKDGVTGSWIRPEDTEAYEKYIHIFEFEDCSSASREQVLFDIYSRGEWAGDLNMIITNLDYPGVNRMIPPELSQRRINCGQRCESNRTCHLCYRLLDLANPEKLKPYAT